MTRAYSIGQPGDYILLGPGDSLPEGFTEIEPPAEQEGFRRVFEGGAWAQVEIATPEPELTFEQKVEAKLEALSWRRFEAETGGTVFNDVPIRTDRETSAIITAAYVSAIENPDFVIPNWKVANGTFMTLDASTIIALANAVRAHVQATFDHEAVLTAQILAAEDEAALDAVDIEAGWPG